MKEFVLPLTQIQLANAVADRADITRVEAKRILAAFEEVVLEELGNAQKVRIGGLVQLTVRVKPAQKARQGRNRYALESVWNQCFAQCNRHEKGRNLKDSTHASAIIAASAKVMAITLTVSVCRSLPTC